MDRDTTCFFTGHRDVPEHRYTDIYNQTLALIQLLYREGIKDFVCGGAVGFDKKQAYQPDPGENLIYPAAKNIDWKQGTLTMWIQARDYQPGIPSQRGNVAYAQLRFTQGTRFVQYLLYEYKGILYWDW